MTAARLREAAKVLRERADKVLALDASPGDAVQNFVAFYADETRFPNVTALDGRYIATMHPGVGLALADWLDGAADNLEKHGNDVPWDTRRAFRVADAILGGEPS